MYLYKQSSNIFKSKANIEANIEYLMSKYRETTNHANIYIYI